MWPDQDGNWGVEQWVDNTGFSNTPTTQAYGNTPVTTTAETSGGRDWSGYLQSLGSTLVNYAIAKDARESGLQPTQYQTTGGQTYRPANNGGVLLLLAALGVGGLLLMRKG